MTTAKKQPKKRTDILSIFSSKFCGTDHQEVNKTQALKLLEGTEYENTIHIVHGFPSEKFPENYLITTSKSDPMSATGQCGYPFLLNTFFISDVPGDYPRLLASFPLKSI